MRILISGASGLIGKELTSFLLKQNHQIARLVRRKADQSKHEIYWDPERGSLDKTPLQDFAPEAVIHLAGENIAQGRWTETKKQKIRDSRVNGTRVLSESIASLKVPPKVLISASAIGYYGDRGDESLTETSEPGRGFLPEVGIGWEKATQAAQDKGIRVVILRTGVVLSKKGGALKKMLLPFKLGLGGTIGNGRQYFSWIDIEDMVNIYLYALENEKMQGPYNAVTPHPVTNKQYTKALGRALFRPTIFPMPASTARMLFGEMAEDLLLASARVFPKRLEESGYQFRYPDLKASLKHLLKGK